MNLTKKITAVFLALAMLFIFASCGEESEEVLDIGTVNIGIIVDGDTTEVPMQTCNITTSKPHIQPPEQATARLPSRQTLSPATVPQWKRPWLTLLQEDADL